MGPIILASLSIYVLSFLMITLINILLIQTKRIYLSFWVKQTYAISMTLLCILSALLIAAMIAYN